MILSGKIASGAIAATILFVLQDVTHAVALPGWIEAVVKYISPAFGGVAAAASFVWVRGKRAGRRVASLAQLQSAQTEMKEKQETFATKQDVQNLHYAIEGVEEGVQREISLLAKSTESNFDAVRSDVRMLVKRLIEDPK